MSPQAVFHASDGAAYEMWLGRWSGRLAPIFLDFVHFPDLGELLEPSVSPARRTKEAVRDAYCSPDGPRSLAASTWAARGKVP